MMLIEIDFQSEEAIYMQLRNQIVVGIAASVIREGDTLPSVRQLAGDIGINMHTVNKAYTVLRQEGFVTIDRRKGAIVSLDADKRKELSELQQRLKVVLAKGICKDISRAEVHEIVDQIYDEFGKQEEIHAR
jgi:DNA-binding transcriptional regulator YhcF (GntR family)